MHYVIEAKYNEIRQIFMFQTLIFWYIMNSCLPKWQFLGNFLPNFGVHRSNFDLGVLKTPEVIFFYLLKINSRVLKVFEMTIWQKSVLGKVFKKFVIEQNTFLVYRAFLAFKSRHRKMDFLITFDLYIKKSRFIYQFLCFWGCWIHCCHSIYHRNWSKL